MPKKKRYMLIVNPEAGSGKTMKVLPQIENILRTKKIEYEFHDHRLQRLEGHTLTGKYFLLFQRVYL